MSWSLSGYLSSDFLLFSGHKIWGLAFKWHLVAFFVWMKSRFDFLYENIPLLLLVGWKCAVH